MRHNEIRGGVAGLAGKNSIPNHMRNNPHTFTGCAVKRTTAKPAHSNTTTSTKKVEATEQRCNLLIRYLWQNVTDSVHDMHVVNNEAKSTEKCLQETERGKKKI